GWSLQQSGNRSPAAPRRYTSSTDQGGSNSRRSWWHRGRGDRRGAFEGIDQAMHTTGCARLRDVKPDMVAMAADALQPQQIGACLEAGKSAVEVRPCPLRKVLARSLAEHPAPYTDPLVAAQKKLIALALVEGAECDQTERTGDRRHHRLEGDLGVE